MIRGSRTEPRLKREAQESSSLILVPRCSLLFNLFFVFYSCGQKMVIPQFPVSISSVPKSPSWNGG